MNIFTNEKELNRFDIVGTVTFIKKRDQIYCCTCREEIVDKDAKVVFYSDVTGLTPEDVAGLIPDFYHITCEI